MSQAKASALKAISDPIWSDQVGKRDNFFGDFSWAKAETRNTEYWIHFFRVCIVNIEGHPHQDSCADPQAEGKFSRTGEYSE